MIVKIDKSWQEIVQKSLEAMDKNYIEFIEQNSGFFPDKDNFLNAFKTLSLDKTKYILFGQDPYPREESAIGYAFIDGRVKEIFDKKGGFTKEVNKATSLRNMMKMLLYCKGELKDDFSKKAVKKVDNSKYINSIYELKDNFEKNGVLLLNRALIFTDKGSIKYHASEWKPFIQTLLEQIPNNIRLILFGNIAKDIDKFPASKRFKKILLPHPYNIKFITDKEVLKLFCPMKLLEKNIEEGKDKM